jgi:uncharacterized protein (TIGR02996 family)
MSHEEGFLQAILAEPENDTHRLVYADWLEEHGDAARAEFIRVQCELARMEREHGGLHIRTWETHLFLFIRLRQVGTRPEPRWQELQDREGELLREHGEAWAKPFLGLAAEGQFRRGFLEQVALTVPQFRQCAATLFALAPIRHVRIREAHGHLAELVECPELSRVHTLDLRDARLEDADVGALAAGTNLRGVAELDLSCNRIGAPGAPALAQSPNVNGLEALNLDANQLGNEGLEALAGSPYLSRLKILKLQSTHIGDPGVVALAASPRLPCLSDLWLIHNRITADGLKALANSPHFGNLEVLAVFGNPLDRRRRGCKLLEKRFGAAVLWEYRDICRPRPSSPERSTS